MRAEHRVKRRLRPVPLETPEPVEYFRIPAPRAGVEKCLPTGCPPAHPAYHHIEPRGAVGRDRIIVSKPGTCNAYVIHLIRRIKDPEGKSPHHAPVAPAPVMAPVHEPCGTLRRGAGTYECKECRGGRAVPFRTLFVPGKKTLYKVRPVKSPACKKRFRDRECLQRIVRVLACLPEMAPSGPHICHPRFRLGRSFQRRTQRVPNCEPRK